MINLFHLHTLNYNSWVDKYSDYLFAYAFYKVGKKEDAEDLVQDTFYAGYKSRATYKGIACEKNWLMAILKNKIIDYYRKPKITDSFALYPGQMEVFFQQPVFNRRHANQRYESVWPVYYSRAADEHLIAKDFQKLLSSCLEKMPPKMKFVFVSKYIEEAAADHICKGLQITPSNYWVMICRGKAILRKYLEKNGGMS